MASGPSVIQVINTLGMGGAETWLMEVLRRWHAAPRQYPRVDFLITSGRRGIFDAEAEKLGARLFYVPFQRKKLLLFARQFRQILRRGRYSAIHDHQDYASGWHFLLGAGCLPRIRVTHIHNPAYQITSNNGVSATRRATGNLGRQLVRQFATHIAGTSRQALDDYGINRRVFPKQKTGALYCGFDPTRFRGDTRAAKRRLCEEFGWPATASVILFAGRIDRSTDPADPQAHKNAPIAVDIAIECRRNNPTVRMLLAGAPSGAVPVLESRISAAGFSKDIVFAGVRRDIEHLMLAADVLLFPSRSEGLGMVAVEAQAAGLPVVASAAVPRECAVVSELVDFVPLDQPVSAWTEVVIRRIAAGRGDPDRSNAVVAASHFAVDVSGQRLADLYRGSSDVLR